VTFRTIARSTNRSSKVIASGPSVRYSPHFSKSTLVTTAVECSGCVQRYGEVESLDLVGNRSSRLLRCAIQECLNVRRPNQAGLKLARSEGLCTTGVQTKALTPRWHLPPEQKAARSNRAGRTMFSITYKLFAPFLACSIEDKRSIFLPRGRTRVNSMG
jgi:hypothetical protein